MIWESNECKEGCIAVQGLALLPHRKFVGAHTKQNACTAPHAHDRWDILQPL